MQKMDCGSVSFVYPTLTEILEPEEAQIEGTLPDWLHDSVYIRTGPGHFDFKDFSVNHFLDGYAILTRFQIDKNSIKYDRKYLQTDAYKKALIAQKPVIAEFGTKAHPDPTKNVLSRFIPSLMPEMSDNCNVCLFTIGNDLFAGADTCMFRKVDSKTLDCGEKYDTLKLFGLNIWSAHPLERDGFIYNIGTSFLRGLKYQIVKIPLPSEGETSEDALKKAKIICSISSRSALCASPCHSFGMTEKYIIFIEQPLIIVAKKMIAGILQKSCKRDYMEYRPEMKNKFHVVEKETGKLLKTEYLSADPFFFLHIVNCFEQGNELVMDMIAFPNANCIHIDLVDFRNGNEGPEHDLATTRRFVIPLIDFSEHKDGDIPEDTNLIRSVKTSATAINHKKVITLTCENLSESGLEVPIVHPNFRGKPYSIFYGGGPRTVGFYKNSLCKVDTRAKESILFRLAEHEFLGEPMFIPNPNGTEEDDGIIISCVTRAIPEEKSCLMFLDGKTMKEIARAEFHNFIPLAVHGIFLPNK
ncbi:unnamed protein product [Orchesella dallaii]|uniref:Beta,beta-carotene 15,15'-monooxygenase n=1 Tax=Orchesella dallaii TaxID=48710 RepID=A0ABP1QVN5_9HEXA